MHRAWLGQAWCQLSQLVAALGPPPAPPRTPRTRDLRLSRSPPTRSLHACDNDATLSI